MLLQIQKVLSAEQLARFRQRLAEAAWADGRITAGYQSSKAKHNLQLAEDDPLARELGAEVLQALQANPVFFSAALPRHIYPPLFNCYRGGGHFGFHIDNALRYDRRQQPAQPIRTDLSATLFLSDPEDYDDGELQIRDTFGEQRIKLAAGDLVLYPGGSLHQVTPVTRGERLACFFWIQSLLREDDQRRLMLELDGAIQTLAQSLPEHPALIQLTGVYHNLLRRWAEP